MKIYAVGGQVRDEILGRHISDRDYVVVGATPEGMLALGYTQVGADFPVFLHPETKEEYALARTERKTGMGHKGFETFYDPNVTIQEDLSRRDLTINAIAKDLETGEIIDPFNGVSDCRSRILRHVSEAFKEDPLRVLRLFRFQSQLGAKWSIDVETFLMVMEMAREGMLKELPAERKWKEMEKALNTSHFAEYAHSMALLGELPELLNLKGVPQPVEHHPEGDAFTHTLLCLQQADRHCGPEVKFAVLCHDFGKAVSYREYGNLLGHEELGVPLVDQLCQRMKVPNSFRDIARYVTGNHTRVHCILPRGKSKGAKAKSVMKIFEKAGSLLSTKTHDKVFALADACFCDAKGRGPEKEKEYYPQGDILLDAFEAACAVDTKTISSAMLEKGCEGKEIGESIRVARISAIRDVLNKNRKD